MKQYAVEITDEALEDMEQLYSYIAYTLNAPEKAIGQYNRISEQILKLNTMPERFQILDLERGHLSGLRRMPIDNYSVFYVIEKDRVVVTNVLYSASDIGRRLAK